jgi:NAD(P)-dependent dehydrogenase (short-subunit alcohol dehydrogenase family)
MKSSWAGTIASSLWLQTPTSLEIHGAAEIHRPRIDEFRAVRRISIGADVQPRSWCTGIAEHATKEIVIMVEIADKSVLVTGGNRGIGRALVEEALTRGATRVYVGTRGPLTHPDNRVARLALDVTNATQIQRAVEEVESLDVLINNAGLALYDDLTDPSVLERHLAVNLYGPYGMIQAFLPLLTRSGGAIVNNLSVNALAPLPLIPAYSVSKAAAFNLTQSLRVLLAPRGVSVHAVLTGPVDTDMTRGFDIPKSSPESVARAIFDGLAKGEEEIFPDPFTAPLAESWGDGPARTLERQYAALSADAEQ